MCDVTVHSNTPTAQNRITWHSQWSKQEKC